MRAIVFSERCVKELLRDPLSWIFCLLFPLAMLAIFTWLAGSIPAEAGMEIFQIDRLCAGIAVFSFTFVMLFAALLISKDRSSAFLTRLFISPMRASDFLTGYFVPFLAITLAQIVITYAASLMIAEWSGKTLLLRDLLLSLVTLLPAAILFILWGILLGTLLNDRSAPGIASIFISAAGMLGGIWMDIDSIGGTLAAVCRVLPFYHAVRLGRAPMLQLSATDAWCSFGVLCAYIIPSAVCTVLLFRRRMKYI